MKWSPSARVENVSIKKANEGLLIVVFSVERSVRPNENKAVALGEETVEVELRQQTTNARLFRVQLVEVVVGVGACVWS